MVQATTASVDFSTERRLTGAYLAIALLALFVGVVTGFLQALSTAGINAYGGLPVIKSYYHGLSLHGVMNVLVWTTFFICGFLPYIFTRALARPLAQQGLAWVTILIMTGGLVLAGVPLVQNNATVMFTFYPPLLAHWMFYVGLTLVVVGTWLVTLNLILTYRGWRRHHADTRTPLPAFMCLITFIMWSIASLGLTAEMLCMLIPWSLGWSSGTDPLLARTLFWFTGHPIVYFWLLPAYISWYTLVPRQAGGKLFSDPMARASFLLFLLLSIPVGLHHQFTDPGIAQGWKLVHAFFTFAVFFPSLLTFFNVVASLETGARARGGRGLIAWFRKLPWSEPVVAAQVLAMLLFAFGGIGGLVNASYSLNLIVHNTMYIVGHFHLTVGTAVTLSFMGITYWLVPVLRRRGLWNKRLALTQAWLWFFSMTLFSFALHDLGMLGMPRRSMISLATYVQPSWRGVMPLVAIGGSVMFLSAMLYFLNLLMTCIASRQPAPEPPAFAEAISGPDEAPACLDRWRPWLVITLVFIVLAYGHILFHLVTETSLNVPGMRVW
jgi:cytochrome c oxidase subunit 1